MPKPLGRSGFRGVHKVTSKQRNKPWQVAFKHQGKLQHFGCFTTAEEAAREHDLKRLELGYEDEGFYNYKLQLGQADMTIYGPLPNYVLLSDFSSCRTREARS
jgi:hypothetical protein